MEKPELRETPLEQQQRETLEADLAESPVKGAPLRERYRNFRPDPDAAIRALGGPLIWMRRLRAIEVLLDAHIEQLDAAWRETEPADWPRVARDWDFSEINDLIERHNRNYPAEARLPMDPRTRDFVRINGRRYEREPLDAEWILSRWPADRRRPQH
ncbi:MAG TPA: hypothetical protein VE261_03020 [Gaiellaceae bacterium]|nr:hypothetical protein [Gaiellaceae bacterium]